MSEISKSADLLSQLVQGGQVYLAFPFGKESLDRLCCNLVSESPNKKTEKGEFCA
jgi:hypothetical protein